MLNPGVETAKIIDKFGLPLPSPRGSGIAANQSYVLSPRGVPTMVPNTRPARTQAQTYKFEMVSQIFFVFKPNIDLVRLFYPLAQSVLS